MLIMAIKTQEEKTQELRKRLSIELCDNFIKRLNPNQSYDIKVGALIAIKNLIKESQISDPFLFSYLVDTIADPDKNIRDIVSVIIKEVANTEIIELLELKLNEITNDEIKKGIASLLKDLPR